MATGAQAVEAMAIASGTPAITVDRLARALKQNRPNLWPRSGQGGGSKAVHVEPSDLVNLILALAYADPLTAAPVVVPVLRGLAPSDKRVSPASGDTARMVAEWTDHLEAEGRICLAAANERYRALPGSTLGEALDNLVDWISRPEGAALRARFSNSDIGVVFPLSAISPPSATVEYQSFKGSSEVTVTDAYHWRQGQLGTKLDHSDAGITRAVRLHFAVFECAAELWADTKRHREETARRATIPPRSSSGNDPEKETAAIHPCQGTDAAAFSDQPAHTDRGSSSHSYSTGEREIPQSPSDVRAGQSHRRVRGDSSDPQPSRRKDSHAQRPEHRHHPARAVDCAIG